MEELWPASLHIYLIQSHWRVFEEEGPVCAKASQCDLGLDFDWAASILEVNVSDVMTRDCRKCRVFSDFR